MNKAFQNVVAHYKVAPILTHQQQVMRLYRRYDLLLDVLSRYF